MRESAQVEERVKWLASTEELEHELKAAGDHLVGASC